MKDEKEKKNQIERCEAEEELLKEELKVLAEKGFAIKIRMHE